MAYDDAWLIVATFREDDTSPKEQVVNHNAGLDGRGSSSYIDSVILRDKDANSGWTSAADGTLEERRYLCQNSEGGWRADVSAIVTSGGYMVEWAKYSPYGIPFGLPGADTDSDGDCDATDITQIQTWIDAGGGTYDVRGDVDLDLSLSGLEKPTLLRRV
ncbi:MAG: hypothetical protein D8M59_06870 [Planctomycetes bacterium]|nr:hypothetical protein [Planctomycetota bacterium]NOG54373.1 hypothetical protein [Planctomycetota bacterium]